MLYLNCFYGYRTFPGSKTTCKIDLWTEKSAKNRGRLRVPIKRKQRMFLLTLRFFFWLFDFQGPVNGTLHDW